MVYIVGILVGNSQSIILSTFINIIIQQPFKYLSRIIKKAVFEKEGFLLVFLFYIALNAMGRGIGTAMPAGSATNIALPATYPTLPATDSFPKTNDVVFVIPFEYKQSSLNFASSFKLMDSIVDLIFMDDSIMFSIDGYSYFDEGWDSICYYLSLNRAGVVKTYVLGRGLDSLRIRATTPRSKFRSIERQVKKEPIEFNCVAEITLHYPIPRPPDGVYDTDEDGIMDHEDSCRTIFGQKAFNGCPNKDAIVVPFEPQQSFLSSLTYKVLDSVINLLKVDPSLTIHIEGHAYEKEGVETLCERLAKDRADMVRRYLLTRQVAPSRIETVKGFSYQRPITANRNPWEKARNSRAEIILVRH